METVDAMIEILQNLEIDVTRGEDVLLPKDLTGAIIDSLDIVNIVTAIEETYGIQMDGLDIIPENFHTVQTMADMVDKYLNAD